ncbi:MAG: hypothetical protein A2Y23_02790 [Clostridiales bacterium GWB2_37_7]|nr:MAG: hypothetical protein A2Y23_02790 [Clostridiales bacterium GWB2_37_7]
MSNSMKTVVFIISLIAYFIYLSISSAFINITEATGSIAYVTLAIFISSAVGILVMLYAQASVKYWYSSRQLKNSTVHVKLPIGKFRLTDRLLVYFIPALAIIIPVAQTRSFSAITWPLVLFLALIIIIVEVLFYVNSKTMMAYITNKGIIIRGIDLRLEIPIPSNYHNPSGYFPFNRIITFLDLNDKLLVEHSHDLGSIILKSDSDTLKQIKAVLIANGIKQKKF